MECSCCGEQRDPTDLTALRCHDDIQVCRGCIRWLRDAAGMVESTATLPVLDMEASASFYRAAGFDVDEYEGGGFAFVTYEDTSVFDLGLEPEAAGAGVYLVVPDPDAWHERLAGLGCQVTEVADQAHGMREFSLTDPSGNRLRFGRPSQARSGDA